MGELYLIQYSVFIWHPFVDKYSFQSIYTASIADQNNTS